MMVTRVFCTATLASWAALASAAEIPACTDDGQLPICKKGADIYGQTKFYQSGYSVSLSADGEMLAFGTPYSDDWAGKVQVHGFGGTSWTQMGQDMVGRRPPQSWDFLGNKVSLSADGKTIAMGGEWGPGKLNLTAFQNGDDDWRIDEAGIVQVYGFDGTSWSQLGQNIEGEGDKDHSGYSLSLSADGKTVAVGAPYHRLDGKEHGAPGSKQTGYVRIFTFDGTSWVQLGQNIDGLGIDSQENFGISLSLSDDGKTVAIATGDESSRLEVYGFDGTKWSQMGQGFDGAGSVFSSVFSLSADGKTVAIGWDGVRVYAFDGTKWSQVAQDITSIEGGQSVSLSADGKTVAFVLPFNGKDSARVAVYTLDGASWSQLVEIDAEAVGDDDGEGWSVAISLSADGTTVAIGQSLYDGPNGKRSGLVRVFKMNPVAILSIQAKVKEDHARIKKLLKDKLKKWG